MTRLPHKAAHLAVVVSMLVGCAGNGESDHLSEIPAEELRAPASAGNEATAQRTHPPHREKRSEPTPALRELLAGVPVGSATPTVPANARVLAGVVVNSTATPIPDVLVQIQRPGTALDSAPRTTLRAVSEGAVRTARDGQFKIALPESQAAAIEVLQIGFGTPEFREWTFTRGLVAVDAGTTEIRIEIPSFSQGYVDLGVDAEIPESDLMATTTLRAGNSWLRRVSSRARAGAVFRIPSATGANAQIEVYWAAGSPPNWDFCWLARVEGASLSHARSPRRVKIETATLVLGPVANRASASPAPAAATLFFGDQAPRPGSARVGEDGRCRLTIPAGVPFRRYAESGELVKEPALAAGETRTID